MTSKRRRRAGELPREIRARAHKYNPVSPVFSATTPWIKTLVDPPNRFPGPPTYTPQLHSTAIPPWQTNNHKRNDDAAAKLGPAKRAWCCGAETVTLDRL